MKIDISFLRKVNLFGDLSDEELTFAASMFRQREYKKNEIIFLEEDTGNYMYIVRQGRVKVSRLLPNGKEMILAFREAGEYFGEMSLLDGGTSPADVTSVTNSVILTTTRRDFQKLLENPRINAKMMEMLCHRCREAWRQIEVLNNHNADARIRTALYHLCQTKGIETAEGTKIDLRLTHKELADMTGISRETATRVLSALQADGTIRVESKRFLISDSEKLMDTLLFD